MIMGARNECPMCGWRNLPTFWAQRQKVFMCSSCMRLHNPPYMTLMKFLQGSYKMLWNLEVGNYENFGSVEDITDCGWFVRSTQTTIYRHEPRVYAKVYHLEYFGSVECGRCVDYKYFDSDTKCLPEVCEKLAVPHKKRIEIQYPPERSRYSKWMKI